MKLYKQIIFILIVFFKTETLFSKSNLFNVNNIQIEKKGNIKNDKLAEQAIKKGFNQLILNLLLKDDSDKVINLNYPSIKELVAYYQIANISYKDKGDEIANFNVTFDKDKMHNLFYEKNISYSKILDNEIFTLPILINDNEIFVFNNNYFYKNWNDIYENDQIEFILPLENIEIIQNINNYKNNLINLEVKSLFEEYSNKNLVVIFIEDFKKIKKKVYIKAIIEDKKISKSLDFEKKNLSYENFKEKIIIEIKKELINLVKSENLIDIRTPNFLNVEFNLDKKNNLVELNLRIKNIESIENLYVQEFNKDRASIRIKYLGKLEKIINQLKKEGINLKLINDQWVIKTL